MLVVCVPASTAAAAPAGASATGLVSSGLLLWLRVVCGVVDRRGWARSRGLMI